MTSVTRGWSTRSVPANASRCRLSKRTTSLASASRRARAVPMKPAPPVITIRLPVSDTARVYRRILGRTMRAFLRCCAVAVIVGPSSPRPRRLPSAGKTALRVVYYEDVREPETRVVLHASLQPGRWHASEAHRRLRPAATARLEDAAPRAARHRVHGDLRWPSGRVRHRPDRRPARLGEAPARQRLRDRPLGAERVPRARCGSLRPRREPTEEGSSSERRRPAASRPCAARWSAPLP